MAVGGGQTSRVLADSSGVGGSDTLGMSTIQLAAAGARTMSWTRAPAPNRSAQVAVAFQSVDTTTPSVPVLTLNEASPLSYINAGRIYYNGQGANSGTFTVDATSADAESGIKKINFPALTGMVGGGDDLLSPYQGSYDWTGTSTAAGAQTVTVTNGQNLTSTATFTAVRDVTAPAGGALTVNGTVATAGGSSSYLTS